MKHLDALAHTRGESLYISDLSRPEGMLHAAIVGASVAHGSLDEINTSAALAIPGVAAVLTAADIPGENQIGPLIQDEGLLAEDSVHFIGQPVAIVLAETAQLAHRATQAVTISIEELPIVVDPRVAYEQGSIIGAERTFESGYIEAAWDSCTTIVEGRTDVGGQEHVYLETQAARAIPLEGGRVQIHSSTQSPYAVQRTAAKVLGIPHHMVTVDVHRIGGGFGGKEDQATPWGCLAALAAYVLQQPVELVLSREDDLVMTGKRHPYSADFKIGLDENLKIIAYEVMHYQNSGAAADLSPAVLERTLFHSTNSYFVPNTRITAASCRTNLPPNTAFRGFGGPQGMFVIEAAISKAAEAIGCKPYEIQRANLLTEGDEFPYGQRATAVRSVQTWQAADEAYDMAAIQHSVDAFNENNKLYKKGFAVMPICFGISFTATFLNQASALVHIYTDGSVAITTGGVEMGQGISTKIANIAAQALGVDPSYIRIESTNTSRIANMSPSAASATTDLCGFATIDAIEQILARLYAHAATQLEVDASTLSVSENKLLSNGKSAGWDWETLVSSAYFARIDLSAHGFYATPKIWFDKSKEKGEPFAYHAYGTALFEVTVDTLRGIYTVDAVKIVHDLGRPLNKLVDIGQLEGGLAQGIGWMTVEDLQYADDGRILSGALASYKVPETYFTPKEILYQFIEDENPTAPLGSKAIGEPPLLYGLGAFFALRNALQAAAADFDLSFHAPMTPERVLTELYLQKELSGTE